MSFWTKRAAVLRKAGLRPADVAATYRPGGYPRLGLAPLHTELSERSTSLLKRQLVSAEHRRGNVRFDAVGLGRLDPRLASELASVYLGLAERYHGVWTDRINFCSNMNSGGVNDTITMAVAWTSEFLYPTLHQLCAETGTMDLGELVKLVRAGETTASKRALATARDEVVNLGPTRWRRDIASHGAIEMGSWLASPTRYGTHVTHYAMRNRQWSERGRPPRIIDNKVSLASYTLIHEFGHVVQAALMDLGPEAYETVMGTLETALLRKANGRWNVTNAQLAAQGLTRADARLLNYPKPFEPASVTAGDGWRRHAVRRLVGEQIAWSVGGYAATSLTEMFAEAFALAHTAKDPELAARLAPFLASLRDVGLARTRRHAF